VADYPITPPPELVKKIRSDALCVSDGQHDYELRMIHAAYAAGADQELEACCEWINSFQNKFVHAHDLRLVRRPKPLSLAERALNAVISGFDPEGRSGQVVIEALNRLAELEAAQ
jgi:hypothetical protein